jgi:hypothetical protein
MGKTEAYGDPNILTDDDWTHRLEILRAWEFRKNMHHCVYRAVKDGCATTIRSLCYLAGISFNFTGWTSNSGYPRLASTRPNDDNGLFCRLEPEAQNDLFKVLFLANRIIAHNGAGKSMEHEVNYTVMTDGINATIKVLEYLSKSCSGLNNFIKQHPELFAEIKITSEDENE